MINRRVILLIAILAACMPGCASTAGPANTTQSAGDTGASVRGFSDTGATASRTSADAASQTSILVRVEVWHLIVPFGTLSRNADFWKRIDETCVDPATADLLQKNGMRVGQAPLVEWEFFRKIMEQNPAVAQQSVFSGAEGKQIEIEMNTNIDFQYIFFFDRNVQLAGRSYDRSDNILGLSFKPTPRKFGAVRIALCPIIRSQKKRLEFNPKNEEREIVVVQPERLFDCDLRTDVPADRFFIVAPSSAATFPLSIGRALLMKDGESEQFEQILLICPKPIRVEEGSPPVAVAPSSAK